MKKINISLIIIIIFLALVKIIGGLDQEISIILKNLSIILTLIVPYIVQKIFKTNLTEGFKLIWIIFIFMAHFLGVICEVYALFPGYDKLVHTMSGVLTAYAAILIINNRNNSKVFNFLFIVSFSALCAVSWEIFEFTGNILVGGDAQKVLETGVNDTMLDMIVALIGSVCFGYIYLRKTS